VRRLPGVAGILDALHPEVRISSLVLRGTRFSPAAVAWLSSFTGVAPNMMLMRAPKMHFAHQVSWMRREW
jgi:hypothetical protein